MIPDFNPDLDLKISRIIRAPRKAVWSAWTEPSQLEQWWLPAPTQCRVVALELKPGGGFVTEMSDDGGPFGPHLSACFLEVEPMARIVFTNALVAGFRPAQDPFMTAIITMADHADGTEYVARAMHKDPETRRSHDSLGFHDGWGTVTRQLAELVER